MCPHVPRSKKCCHAWNIAFPLRGTRSGIAGKLISGSGLKDDRNRATAIDR